MGLRRLFSVIPRIQIIMILAFGFSCMISPGPAHADPSAFALLSPEDGASVPTALILDWEDSADPDGLTYTILLSEGDDAFDDPILIERVGNSVYLLEETDGIKDITTYYWKVQAVSKYGRTSETGVRYFETDNNANPKPAWIGGYVYRDGIQRTPISRITVQIVKWDKTFTFLTDILGYFLGKLSPDDDKPPNPGTEEEVTAEVSGEGYIPETVSVTITFGELTETHDILLDRCVVTGDISRDCHVTLTDAVLALQILTGGQPSETADREVSLNTERIGLADAVYILRSLTGENSEDS